MNDNKRKSVLKLLVSYPSFQANDQTTAAAVEASYVELLSGFSDSVVERACLAARKKPAAFPPSAGELYEECNRVCAADERDRQWQERGSRLRPVPRLSPPSRSYSLAELADWELAINHVSPPYVLRVGAAGEPLRIPEGYPGAGKEAPYGYLTPREAEMVKASKRRVSARNHMSEAAE